MPQISLLRPAARIASLVARRRNEFQFFAGAIALSLGFWGWSIERPATDWSDYLNNAFRTLQLITLNFPTNFDGKLSWQLQIARLLVPLVAVLASFNVLMGTVTRPLRLALLPRARGHIVVLGDTKLTEAALIKLSERGQKIVIVAPMLSTARCEALESRGLTVVEADLQRDGGLRHLSLKSAAALFVTGPDDLDNLNLAISALSSAEGRSGNLPPLIIAVLIEREDLAAQLDRALENVVRRHRLRYYRLCPDREGLRLALGRFAPAFTKTDRDAPGHALIVGLVGRYEQVLSELLLAMQDHPDERPLLSLALTERELRAFSAWRADRPDLDLVARFEVIPREEGRLPTEPIFAQWRRSNGVPHLALLLASDADAVALAFAMRGARAVAGIDSVPILVRQDREDRLLLAVDKAAASGSAPSRMAAFGGLIRIESLDRVLNRKGDEVAMALHAGYLVTESGKGPQASDAAIREWDSLSETLREANRTAAEHLPILLASEELEVVEASKHIADGRATVVPDEGMIERLARIEHRHWMAARLDQGWRFGPTRNDTSKIHPAIVPFEQLDEANKQKDRDTILRLIGILSNRGFIIRRTIATS